MNFYSELKFIELDHSVSASTSISISTNEYVYMDIIWTHEHYEFIESIRSVEPDIKSLLTKSHKLGLITNIQFKLAKKIFKSINLIFESDAILRDFYTSYNDKNNNICCISKVHLEYYFNIIEIIILKMYSIERSFNNKSNNINLLLKNANYLNDISKLKNLLENQYYSK